MAVAGLGTVAKNGEWNLRGTGTPAQTYASGVNGAIWTVFNRHLFPYRAIKNPNGDGHRFSWSRYLYQSRK
jgi:hypothetical protein